MGDAAHIARPYAPSAKSAAGAGFLTDRQIPRDEIDGAHIIGLIRGLLDAVVFKTQRWIAMVRRMPPDPSKRAGVGAQKALLKGSSEIMLLLYVIPS